MASKREEATRQAKEAKQKKLLFALVPVFIGLIAWQGPKTFNALSGGDAPPAPAAVATTATATNPSVPTTATPGVSSASAPGSPTLDETDPLLGPLEGQLVSFSRFTGKDPFRQSGSAPTAPTDSVTTPTDESGDEAASTTAVLEVNGTAETAAVGDQFPAGDPQFQLVSISGQTAQLGLVSGEFSTGSDTIAVNVGETLVLVSDDGARYAIKLVSVSGP